MLNKLSEESITAIPDATKYFEESGPRERMELVGNKRRFDVKRLLTLFFNVTCEHVPQIRDVRAIKWPRFVCGKLITIHNIHRDSSR